jgi:GNAT superfamily N-acetyltransferase
MLHIIQVESDEQRQIARMLLSEYLNWVASNVQRAENERFDAAGLLTEAMRVDGKFVPPSGRMLLAWVDDAPAGVICLRKLDADIGEIKRMYLRPEFRGKGLGRLLLERLCAEARQIGYTKLRLDSTPFMTSAHALYHSVGFRDIEPYSESGTLPEFAKGWLFMELTL